MGGVYPVAYRAAALAYNPGFQGVARSIAGILGGPAVGPLSAFALSYMATWKFLDWLDPAGAKQLADKGLTPLDGVLPVEGFEPLIDNLRELVDKGLDAFPKDEWTVPGFVSPAMVSVPAGWTGFWDCNNQSLFAPNPQWCGILFRQVNAQISCGPYQTFDPVCAPSLAAAGFASVPDATRKWAGLMGNRTGANGTVVRYQWWYPTGTPTAWPTRAPYSITGAGTVPDTDTIDDGYAPGKAVPIVGWPFARQGAGKLTMDLAPAVPRLGDRTITQVAPLKGAVTVTQADTFGFPPFEFQRPPEGKTKERKQKTLSSVGVWKSIIGKITESRDFIQAWYKALPDWLKTKYYKPNGDRRKPTILEMMQDIYDAWDLVDHDKYLHDVVVNVIENEIQDRFYGTVGTKYKQAYKKAVESGYFDKGTGFQAGDRYRPGVDRKLIENDTNYVHELVVWVVDQVWYPQPKP